MGIDRILEWKRNKGKDDFGFLKPISKRGNWIIFYDKKADLKNVLFQKIEHCANKVVNKNSSCRICQFFMQ